MMLRFGVTNRLSMRDRQELVLVASSLRDAREGLIDCPVSPTGSALPTVLIYGANASGKTNFLESISAFRWLVMFSHQRGEPGSGVPFSRPFALNPACSENRTSFDVDFVIDGVRHHYGFEMSDDAFLSEWLYAFPKARSRMLFERDGTQFDFGRSLSGKNRTISELVRPNSLFLSAAAQNGHKQLSSLYSYFGSIQGVMGAFTPGDTVSSHLGKSEPDRRAIDFLDRIDTGIVDFRRKELEVPEYAHTMIPETSTVRETATIRPNGTDAETSENRGNFELGHRVADKKTVYLNLDSESAGTRRLLVMLGYVFRALDKGVPICIDELDASLHTAAAEEVLALFCSRTTNPHGAQLIATTHDTQLLQSPLLRRDQVWFVEKDMSGASQIFPLTDFRTRKGDDLEKGYLQGRYGGVPSILPGAPCGAQEWTKKW